MGGVGQRRVHESAQDSQGPPQGQGQGYSQQQQQGGGMSRPSSSHGPGGAGPGQFGAPQQHNRPPSNYGASPRSYGRSPSNFGAGNNLGPGSNTHLDVRPRSGGFDGPNDVSRRPTNSGPPPNVGGGSQSGSQQGSQHNSREGSRRPTISQPAAPPANLFGPSLGYDPAKPTEKKSVITNRRVELPAAAYLLDNPNYEENAELVNRPGYNTQGKAILVRVNQYKVTKVPSLDVYQYDILIGNGAEKRGLIKKVWESPEVQNAIRQVSQVWLWDGNKIAWSSKPCPRSEIRVTVNLDAGRANPRPAGSPPNTSYCIIRQTKVLRMIALKAYLEKTMKFDVAILEAINFLDHLMREWPTQNYVIQKRNFFARAASRFPLDNVIEAMKGVYSSMRLCQPMSSSGPSTGLAVNVDVANGTFWTSQDVCQAARNLCKERNPHLSYQTFRDLLRPRQGANTGGRLVKSDDFMSLQKMKKLRFTVKHQGKQSDSKEYIIKSFTFGSEPMYHKDGKNALNTSFTPKPSAQDPKPQPITIFEYFRGKYNVNLTMPWLPLIETEKNGYFPMEVSTLVANQKYQFKLDPNQTSNMIKFAVTRPAQRIQSINHGIGMLKWDQDPYLKHFGMEIDGRMTETKARLLAHPIIEYRGNTADPKTSGRWDLRGKKFFGPNPEPLISWGICVIESCLPEPVIQNFISVFVQTYQGHGGNVPNKNPLIYRHNRNEQLGDMVASVRMAVGNKFNQQPQIILFVMPGRNSFMYERLKKNMECRFAMVSQMMNIAHVQKAQPQYCSNVCMKLNAKLGGTTSKVSEGKPAKPFFNRPTMIIGADVSHASPGSVQASMAAITVSMDRIAARYAAAVQTNGHRVEMITEDNLREEWFPLFRQWVKNVGGGNIPQHIYYFRDGVSEGQFQHVLDQEVGVMKKILADKYELGKNIRWTVVVCTKRHHLRFFPRDNDSGAGDRNGNPLPGTLVERDITHPFEYDFYLSSHSAIQGTARPVHYQVILDEQKVDVNDFQRMIYQHCYQYMRSTTPVSLYPAVYYAHLASNRARSHDDAPASEGPRGGEKFLEARQDAQNARNARPTSLPPTSTTGSSREVDIKPLLPMGSPKNMEIMIKIRTSMWYI